MNSRLSFVENQDPSQLDKRAIRDKLNLLVTDLKELINTMEKVCSSIDENYAEQGIIGTKKIDDDYIYTKRINDNGKLKVITYVNSNSEY